MYAFTANAEVRNINLRAENHGEDVVPAMDIKFLAKAVEIDKLTSAVALIDRCYDGDVVVMGDVSPLIVQHAIEDVTLIVRPLQGAMFADTSIELAGKIKEKQQVKLLPNRMAEVLLVIQVQHAEESVGDMLPHFKGEVHITVAEQVAQEDAA